MNAALEKKDYKKALELSSITCAICPDRTAQPAYFVDNLNLSIDLPKVLFFEGFFPNGGYCIQTIPLPVVITNGIWAWLTTWLLKEVMNSPKPGKRMTKSLKPLDFVRRKRFIEFWMLMKKPPHRNIALLLICDWHNADGHHIKALRKSRIRVVRNRFLGLNA
jgi:hypothetical protein